MPNWFRRASLALCSALAVSTVGAAFAPTASAADFVRGVYAADPGICGDTRVLGTISSKFRHQVRNVPNLPQVDILDYRMIRETRYLPSGENRPIDRRYCQANVALSDGQAREIWYLIEHPMGFASIGGNVEFCVSGFDRWRVYGGNCRVLR